MLAYILSATCYNMLNILALFNYASRVWNMPERCKITLAIC